MNTIKNIVFDFGGVLLHLDEQRTYQQLGDIIGKNLAPASITQDWKYHLEQFEMGKMGDESFLWKFQQATNGKANPQDIIKAWNAMLVDIRPEIFDFLTSVKRKYRVFLLSNTNNIHIRYVTYRILERKYQITNWPEFFDGVFYSHDLGMRKPNPNIYEKVNQLAKVDKSETLFIDDNKGNIEAAKEFGWHTALHPSNERIEDYFKKYIAQIEN